MIAIRKNSREELRVSVEEFRGHRLLNLRVWYEAEGGEMRPSKKGLALKAELAGDLLEAIRGACDGTG